MRNLPARVILAQSVADGQYNSFFHIPPTFYREPPQRDLAAFSGSGYSLSKAMLEFLDVEKDFGSLLIPEMIGDPSAGNGDKAPSLRRRTSTYFIFSPNNFQEIADYLCRDFSFDEADKTAELLAKMLEERCLKDASEAWKILQKDGFKKWGWMTKEPEKMLNVLDADRETAAVGYYLDGLRRTNGSLYELDPAVKGFGKDTPVKLLFTPVPHPYNFFSTLFTPSTFFAVLYDPFKPRNVSQFHLTGVYSCPDAPLAVRVRAFCSRLRKLSADC